MIDGIRRYIAFVSHGSSGPETNWSVPIISRTTDTLSCLKTDNQNLITMNTEKIQKYINGNSLFRTTIVLLGTSRTYEYDR